MNKEYTFTINNEKNEEITCEILAYINREEEKLNPIIIYTDYSIGSDNKINLYVSELIPSNVEMTLGEITEEEYEKMPRIREIMEEIWKEKKQNE